MSVHSDSSAQIQYNGEHMEAGEKYELRRLNPDRNTQFVVAEYAVYVWSGFINSQYVETLRFIQPKLDFLCQNDELLSQNQEILNKKLSC